MKTKFLKNRKIRVLLNIILLAVLVFASCKKEKEDPFGEYANLSPDVWAPQSLVITDVSITEKRLEWTYQVTNIEGFKLDRKVGNGAWEVDYRVFPKEVRFWNDENINPDESLTYNYRISAYAGNFTSSYDETSSAIIFPAPDSVITEKMTEKKYKIKWKDNSNGEQGFKIDHKVDEGDWEIGYGVVPANQTSFIDTNVFRSANIQYRVYGYYENFTSEKTEVNTNASLTPPSDLQITLNSTTSASLQWNDNSDGEDDFIVEKKYLYGTWAQVASVKTNTFIDNVLLFDTVVFYRVCAHAGQYSSSYTEDNISAYLSPPSNFHITKTSVTSVTLSWNNNNSIEVGFKIERRNGNGQWDEIATTSDHNYTDNDFELNSIIYYRIWAFVSTYTSFWLENNFDSTIPIPQNLFVELNSASSIKLHWNYILSGNQGFKIDRKINQGLWEIEYANLSPNMTNFVDFVDWNSNLYTYRVYSYYQNLNSNKIEITAKIQIGTLIYGGYVFYLDNNNGGLVCSVSDQSGAKWGCRGTEIGGTGSNVGQGDQNTNRIVNGCNEAGIAARICSDLVFNGYSDWFLPSKDELYLMYVNISQAGIGDFNGTYWSSTEDYSLWAWGMNFSNAVQNDWDKVCPFNVRAIRSFSNK